MSSKKPLDKNKTIASKKKITTKPKIAKKQAVPTITKLKTAEKKRTTVKKQGESLAKVSPPINVNSNKFRPIGSTPLALVIRKYGNVLKTRLGHGFSRAELKTIGLHLASARRFGLEVDLRRKTEHKMNIDALKKFLGL